MSAESRINAANFDRFAVVLFGSPEVIAAVQALRDQLPPSGRPILPGHVTIKGTFVRPRGLDWTVQMLRTICADFAPIALAADRCQTWNEGLFCGAWLDVELTDALAALHLRLVEELADHGETIYPGEASGKFRPHMTIVQEVAADLIESVVETINAAEHRFSWTAHEVALVGRRGGLAWETLTTFPLRSKS